MKFITFASVLSFALAVSAKDIDVDVGEDGFTFSPSDIKCSSGDTVTFHFYPGGHSVVSSDFNSPCSSNGMIASGTVNSKSGESDMVFVVDCPSSATYLFCSQFGHCKGGMVAAINAPTSGNTLAAYKSSAGSKGADNGPIAGVKGGTLTTQSSESSGSSSTAAATGTGTAAASSSPTASVSPSTPAAATGNDASTSHASSVAVVVFVAFLNALLMA